jgi:hypothetical protein
MRGWSELDFRRALKCSLAGTRSGTAEDGLTMDTDGDEPARRIDAMQSFIDALQVFVLELQIAQTATDTSGGGPFDAARHRMLGAARDLTDVFKQVAARH